MRFNVSQNIYNHQGSWITPANMDLNIWFDRHDQSPLRCTQSSSPEHVGLQSILDKMFSTGRNYVETHGSTCQLNLAVEYTVEGRTEAGLALTAPVIELLESLGHTYDSTLACRFGAAII